jgi:hypothetical protein
MIRQMPAAAAAQMPRIPAVIGSYTVQYVGPIKKKLNLNIFKTLNLSAKSCLLYSRSV